MSRPVSRVLSWTAIYLDAPLPVRSSHLLKAVGQTLRKALLSHGVASDRVYSDGHFHAVGRALISAFPSLPCPEKYRNKAVYLCCTFPEVAFGGRYPLSLPCEARTFLMHSLSACARGCPACSDKYNTSKSRKCQTLTIQNAQIPDSQCPKFSTAYRPLSCQYPKYR